MFKGGDSLLIETNTGAYGVLSHLFFLILDPDPTTGETVIVNIERHDSPRQDTTVLLQKGDHPFVNEETIVNYFRASVTTVQKLQALVAANKAKPREPACQELLDRLKKGLKVSNRTPEGVKDFYADRVFGKGIPARAKSTGRAGR